MIKRTLCFSNPAYLSLANKQLVIKSPQGHSETENSVRTVPVEDIGIVLLDNRQITLTQGLMSALLGGNVAMIVCDESHMPVGLQLPLDGNTLQSERFRDQIQASLPLKKQLWQQTVQAKIRNQAALLSRARHVGTGNMMAWADRVKSGDPENLEARAAAYYWRNMFPMIEDFSRDRYGVYPNSLLNYGYAVLRAVVARALVASGLLPTLGIHHHNRYNAYCLADDIMEPYRPYVDEIVLEMYESRDEYPVREITKEVKMTLLGIPATDVVIGGSRSPLMNAASQTTASLMKCFSGESRKILYPDNRQL